MTIEQTIAEELEAYKKVPWDLCGPPPNSSDLEVKRRFMNNFFLYFLSEETPGNYRGLHKRTGLWNTKRDDWIQEHTKDPEERERRLKIKSPLMRNQTGEEMSNTLWNIVKQRGIEIPEMERIASVYSHISRHSAEQQQYAINTIFSIYVEARKQGYWHEDLRT